jgi:outer membrane receptor protein involved in Fe transport
MELKWRVSDSVTLQTSGTWAEHVYAFDRDVGRNTEDIVDGNEVDTAPNTIAFARVSWEPSEYLKTGLQIVHTGQYFTDAANLHEYPGHEIVDWDISWSLNPASSLNFSVNNLLDTRYATRADFAFGNERYFPGEERHYSLSYKLVY